MDNSWYSDYDALIGRVCPDYDVSLTRLVESVPEGVRSIVELGTGTGNLTERLALRLPNAHIVGYDNNPLMLQKAKEKLKQYSNVSLALEDAKFADYNETDTVVSSLLFHLLPKDVREEIFRRIVGSGVKQILIFDRIQGETPEEEEMFKRNFRLNLAGLPQQLIDELSKENNTNQSDRLSEQIRFFEERGYSFNMIFQNQDYGFAVYSFELIN